jgi:hypothetical protein
MEITDTIKPKDRNAWREWLDEHHKTLTEIWLLSDDSRSQPPGWERPQEAPASQLYPPNHLPLENLLILRLHPIVKLLHRRNKRMIVMPKGRIIPLFLNRDRTYPTGHAHLNTLGQSLLPLPKIP